MANSNQLEMSDKQQLATAQQSNPELNLVTLSAGSSPDSQNSNSNMTDSQTGNAAGAKYLPPMEITGLSSNNGLNQAIESQLQDVEKSLGQISAELQIESQLLQIQQQLTTMSSELNQFEQKSASGGAPNAGGDNTGTTAPAGGTTDNTGTTAPAGGTTDNTGTTAPAGGTTDNTGTTAPAGGTTEASRTSTTPFASDSLFNLPLGSDQQWTANSQLAGAGVYVNTEGNFNEPIYEASSSDPLVTITNTGAAGEAPSTMQVNIPADALPSQPTPGDNTLSVIDPSTNTYASFGGFTWTGPNSATVAQGSVEPLNGSGITQANGMWDEGVGTLTQADLNAGTIDHMLRIELPTTMLQSVDPNSTNDLAPNAWPNTEEDGFANNGNGGPAYSGTVPYGVTVGIPDGTAEPADVAANPGANMLWQALQDHGAMVRDSGGGQGSNNIIIQADQNVSASDPLIQDMEQYGSEIMPYVQILANQGPNSVNGGGTPVVPLDAAIAY